MRGKSMRGDGVFDMRRFCISPDCPQLLSKNETRGGVLYRPHGLDRKTLMRSALCNRISSAVIVSYARHLASKVSIRRGDSDLSRRAALLATLLGAGVRGVGGDDIALSR